MLAGATSNNDHNGILFRDYRDERIIGKGAEVFLFLMLSRELAFRDSGFLKEEVFDILLGKATIGYG